MKAQRKLPSVDSTTVANTLPFLFPYLQAGLHSFHFFPAFKLQKKKKKTIIFSLHKQDSIWGILQRMKLHQVLEKKSPKEPNFLSLISSLCTCKTAQICIQLQNQRGEHLTKPSRIGEAVTQDTHSDTVLSISHLHCLAHSCLKRNLLKKTLLCFPSSSAKMDCSFLFAVVFHIAPVNSQSLFCPILSIP